MNRLIITILLTPCFLSLKAQTEERVVASFNKLIISPIIDVELIKGDTESVRIWVENVALDQVNTKVKGKTLKIYLDNARVTTKPGKVYDPSEPDVIFSRSRYYGAKVKAHITYKELKRIEVRGDGTLDCEDRLGSEKFKLKLYGEVDARIASIDAKKLKITAIGDNRVRIGGGAVDRQTYKMFGENTINTTSVNSLSSKVSVFGEGAISLSTDESLKLSSFGDSRIYYEGNPRITRSIVLGDMTIRPN